MIRHPPRSPLFPYTPLSRSNREGGSPFRRSRHLALADMAGRADDAFGFPALDRILRFEAEGVVSPASQDRKSTRLNSSHVRISYAGFFFKKKNEQSACRTSC